MNLTTRLGFFLILASLHLSACAFASGRRPNDFGRSQIANPSSEYCVKVGGQPQLVSDGAGNQNGLCAMGGASVEEWTLWRRAHGRQQAALSLFETHPSATSPTSSMQHGHGSPAALYCAQLLGTPVTVKDESGAELGICEFTDGSQIEEWTLYRGPKDSANAALTALLKQI